MSSTLQPLSQGSRDQSLDVLRGFALAGVLFTFCASDIGTAAGYTNTFLDELIAWPKFILIESRMYTMLIIIFGIGFHVQLEKAKKYGRSLVPFFTRRLLGLLIIGCIHAILLSTRDILIFYAVAGIVLLLIGKATNRQLLLLMAILLLVVTPVTSLFANGYQAFRLPQPNNYADHVRHNWEFFKLYHQIYPIYIEMLIHFLLGFYISRSGLFQKLKNNKKLRRSLLIVSLAATVVIIPILYFWLTKVFPGFVTHLDHVWQKLLAGTGFRVLWQVWMLVSVSLYSTLLINWSVQARNNWLKPLACFGQMALSNYLIQSIVLVPYLLLLNKYSNMPPFNGFLLFLVVLALQLLFSSAWLKYFFLGPLEWLLRSFTYWKWQPLRKEVRVFDLSQSFLIQKSN